MKTTAALLALAFALPAAAQVVPDDFPDHTEPIADRVRKDFVERYRPFLSGLYGEGTVAAGPVLRAAGVYGSATAEGGYRFDGGTSVSVLASFRTPLGADPLAVDPATGGVPGDGLTGSFGAQVGLALRGLAPRSRWARRAEVGLGAGAAFYEGGAATTVHVAPRVALPLTPTLSVPVGLRLSQEIGGPEGRGPFVGLSLGLRRIWADEARMVLR